MPTSRSSYIQRKLLRSDKAVSSLAWIVLPLAALEVWLQGPRRDAVYGCCFCQNGSRPCDAEPPITQGMPTATWPRAAAETQPSATAPTPTWPQKSRLRLESEPLVLSSSTAASASLRTAPSCTVSAASITSASGALTASGWLANSP